jgi:hypothetical protein
MIRRIELLSCPGLEESLPKQPIVTSKELRLIPIRVKI